LYSTRDGPGRLTPLAWSRRFGTGGDITGGGDPGGKCGGSPAAGAKKRTSNIAIAFYEEKAKRPHSLPPPERRTSCARNTVAAPGESRISRPSSRLICLTPPISMAPGSGNWPWAGSHNRATQESSRPAPAAPPQLNHNKSRFGRGKKGARAAPRKTSSRSSIHQVPKGNFWKERKKERIF